VQKQHISLGKVQTRQNVSKKHYQVQRQLLQVTKQGFLMYLGSVCRAHAKNLIEDCSPQCRGLHSQVIEQFLLFDFIS
jgi:hypothetical protein